MASSRLHLSNNNHPVSPSQKKGLPSLVSKNRWLEDIFKPGKGPWILQPNANSISNVIAFFFIVSFHRWVSIPDIQLRRHASRLASYFVSQTIPELAGIVIVTMLPAFILV